MQPAVMGILNVTPDSFSDGGQWFDHDAAVAHGMAMFADGAAIVDVGGESTRPGAAPVDEAEELHRVLPVIEALAPHGRISIDTRHERVAPAALAAGATIVNDVSASLCAVAADAGAAWVAVHMAGDPRTMQVDPHYDDVVSDVRSFLVERAERGLGAGCTEVYIDPGIGFGKNIEHNLTLLGRLSELVDTGFPVCIGASRKSFLGKLLAQSDQPPLPGMEPSAASVPAVPVDDRIEGSLAVAVWALVQGAAIVRVHDVQPTAHALRLTIPAVA